MFRPLQFLARFNGHTKLPFSVLHHALHGALALRSLAANPERPDKDTDALMRAFLVHDLCETEGGDVPSPLKCDCTRTRESAFMQKLLERKDWYLHGKDLEEALQKIEHLDKSIVAEEAQYFQYPKWEDYPDLNKAPRPQVWSAIKEVQAVARKNRSHSFGVATLAPARIEKWLTVKTDEKFTFEWVVYGLQHTE